MAWYYQESTGILTKDGVYIDTGYSGNTVGLNNPAMCDVANVGPLPPDNYKIGPPRFPIDHLGPFAMPLTPTTPLTDGRGGFFIHGDSPLMNHTASDGCMIFQRSTRIMINASDDKLLTVIP